MFEALTDFINRKILRTGRARWNHQFKEGHWDGLKNDEELVRQKLVRDHFIKYKNGGSLLELGCGQGYLPELVFEKKYFSEYLGVDISDVAIADATKRTADKNIKFEQGDMNTWTTMRKFDVVLFNEAINYAKNCEAVLFHAKENFIAPDGICIISMHEHKRSPEIWAAARTLFTPLESEIITVGIHSWRVEVLKPKK